MNYFNKIIFLLLITTSISAFSGATKERATEVLNGIVEIVEAHCRDFSSTLNNEEKKAVLEEACNSIAENCTHEELDAVAAMFACIGSQAICPLGHKSVEEEIAKIRESCGFTPYTIKGVSNGCAHEFMPRAKPLKEEL